MLNIWDFLIGSKPAMIIFLVAAILIEEFEHFSTDHFAEIFEKNKKIVFTESRVRIYTERASELWREFISVEKNVNKLNSYLLKE